jgi:hypothetical protein
MRAILVPLDHHAIYQVALSRLLASFAEEIINIT